jgi:hypothetical protein
MAILIPNLETAKAAKQKPTEGELFLLEHLETRFGKEVEVYFQPCFNGDRPDIVLMSPNLGVIIIEVKDWNLDLYSIDHSNKWWVNTASGQQQTKSPFQQVFAYKTNFFNIHVNGLLEKNLKNDSFFGKIKTYVYFHRGDEGAIKRLYQPHIDRLREQSQANVVALKSKHLAFEEYDRTRIFLDRSRRKFERDKSFTILGNRLQNICFPLAGKNNVFDAAVYDEFKRLLDPPRHYASQGKLIRYSDEQGKLIQSAANARTKVCGIAGSGKTVVLAGRAVNAHKRHGEQVLILTFNITLGSYIHDKISEVREDFPWTCFEISHYHRFITGALNNSGIEIKIPESLQYNSEDFAAAKRIAKERARYLDENYYSNTNVFKGAEVGGKYNTILIDEIQDYKAEWIEIIRSCFLEPDGEMVLFGDEKQNIYKRALDQGRRSKVVEGFGNWTTLTKSFRYAAKSPIIPLIEAFQKHYMLSDYEQDVDESFQLGLTNVGIQTWCTFDIDDLSRVAATIILLAKRNRFHPNDISIISSQEALLRKLDYELRTSDAHKERTLCSFSSHEVSTHNKYSKSSVQISRAKKIGFNLNSGVMKLSSTHSFKGFESPLIFLLINNDDSPEMVLTGMTRAKENLMVMLEPGSPYMDFFRNHLNLLDLNTPTAPPLKGSAYAGPAGAETAYFKI